MRNEKLRRTSAVLQALALAGFVLAFSVGCAASAVSRGADFYRQGRYIDADQLLEHHEAQLSGYDTGEAARYALYRGATFLALGDPAGARRWLGYGAQLSRSAPALLSAQEQQLLQDSWRALAPPRASRAAVPVQAARPWELAGASSGAFTVSTGQ